MVATRTAVDRCGPGHVTTPLSPTGTEQGQGRGGGFRVELCSEDPEASRPTRRQAPCTIRWTWMTCLPPVAPGQTVCLTCLDRRSGCSGTPWTRSSTPFLIYRRSMLLCRSRWNSWWMCSVFVDVLVPVAEQVIEVPKIILENIPSRRLVRDPQVAEQLVDVPSPSPAHVPVPRMEDHLVEVPQIVTHIVPQSFFVSTDGHVWSQLSGPSGVHWWRCGTSHTQWTPPTRVHRQARAVNKYWPGVMDVPSIIQLAFEQSKSYVFCGAIQFPRQSAGHSSCATEGRFHSSVLEQGC